MKEGMSMLNDGKRAYVGRRGIAALFVSAAMVGTIGLAGCGSSAQSSSASQESASSSSSSATSSSQQDQAPANDASQQGMWVISKVKTTEEYKPSQGDAATAESEVANTLDEHGNAVVSTVNTTYNGEKNVREVKSTFDEKGLILSSDIVSYNVGDEANKISSSDKYEWKLDDKGQPINSNATRSDGTSDSTAYEYSDAGLISKRTHDYVIKQTAEGGTEIEVKRSSEMPYNELGFPLSEHATATVEGGQSQALDVTYEYKDGNDGKPASCVAKCDEYTNNTSFSYDENGNLNKQVEDIEYTDGTKLHRETTREYEYKEAPSQWRKLLEHLAILG